MRGKLLIVGFGKAACSAADYHTLGLQPGAGLEQVKAAYRQEALKWHPDRNDDPSATTKFRELTDAYSNIKGSSNVNVPKHAFNEFMFSFSSGKTTGSSTSSSTTISNGKRITKTVKKDLASGKVETTVIEEDLRTGLKYTHNSIEL